MNDQKAPILAGSLPHLRVSLFGNCNFRCTYCPPWGENRYEIGGNLSTGDLSSLLKALAASGFDTVKLTGGEPTLRRDVVDVVRLTTELFTDVRLITNGWKLARIADDLANAGLQTIELSLDASTAASFDRITQTSGQFEAVLDGLDRCLAAGVRVQINMVVMRENLGEVAGMIDLVESRGSVALKLLELVYYEYPGYDFWKANFVDLSEVTPGLESRALGTDWLEAPGGIGTPMRQYRLANDSVVIVKDGGVGAVYAAMCDGCSLFPCQDGLYGMAVTNDGSLKMCKHRPDLHVSVRDADTGLLTDASLEAAVAEVVRRYQSAAYRSGGWREDGIRDPAPEQLVPATLGVVRWYRGRQGSRLPAAEDSIVAPIDAADERERVN